MGYGKNIGQTRLLTSSAMSREIDTVDRDGELCNARDRLGVMKLSSSVEKSQDGWTHIAGKITTQFQLKWAR